MKINTHFHFQFSILHNWEYRKKSNKFKMSIYARKWCNFNFRSRLIKKMVWPVVRLHFFCSLLANLTSTRTWMLIFAHQQNVKPVVVLLSWVFKIVCPILLDTVLKFESFDMPKSYEGFNGFYAIVHRRFIHILLRNHV